MLNKSGWHRTIYQTEWLMGERHQHNTNQQRMTVTMTCFVLAGIWCVEHHSVRKHHESASETRTWTTKVAPTRPTKKKQYRVRSWFHNDKLRQATWKRRLDKTVWWMWWVLYPLRPYVGQFIRQNGKGYMPLRLISSWGGVWVLSAGEQLRNNNALIRSIM